MNTEEGAGVLINLPDIPYYHHFLLQILVASSYCYFFLSIPLFVSLFFSLLFLLVWLPLLFAFNFMISSMLPFLFFVIFSFNWKLSWINNIKKQQKTIEINVFSHCIKKENGVTIQWITSAMFLLAMLQNITSSSSHQQSKTMESSLFMFIHSATNSVIKFPGMIPGVKINSAKFSVQRFDIGTFFDSW